MLIFLDIDGVLVPNAGWKAPTNLEDGMPMFKSKAVDALNILLKDKPTVVLTSSHRTRFTVSQWKNIFERRGIYLDEILMLGPNPRFQSRRDEILRWLADNPRPAEFIIIDDDTSLHGLPEDLMRHVIVTKPLVCLTEEDVIEKINRFRTVANSLNPNIG
jgi:hypothetical protein